MATLAVVPPTAPGETRAHTSLSLYAIEENLAALTETAEAVPAEQEEEFLKDLGQAILAAVDKRDRVGQFLNHLDAQVVFAKTEIARLQARKQAYESVQAKIEAMVLRVVLSRDPDAKGLYPKLEGRTVSFGAKKCPASVALDDETLVPAEFKTLTIKLPALLWGELLDGVDLELRAQALDAVKRADCACDKTAIKAALQEKREVPGAHLVEDKRTLVRE